MINFGLDGKKVHFDQTKKIKVKSINLKNFCEKKKIDKILYLHIDAQGSDLEILRSLKKNINNVFEGVVEVAKNKSTAIYNKNHTVKEVKNFLKKNFIIKKVEANTVLNNEYNIFFLNKNLNSSKINKNYNLRYFYRTFNNKNNFKDNLFDFLSQPIINYLIFD